MGIECGHDCTIPIEWSLATEPQPNTLPTFTVGGVKELVTRVAVTSEATRKVDTNISTSTIVIIITLINVWKQKHNSMMQRDYN